MSDFRNEGVRRLLPLRASTVTGSRPPVPFSALSASDSGQRMGGASRASSDELNTIRAPFQKTRGSCDSTVSAALGAVPSDGAPRFPLAGPSVPAPRPAAWFYELAAGSYGACGRCRCPVPPTEGIVPGEDEEVEGAASVTRWFGKSREGSLPLLLSRLHYPWRRHARTGVTYPSC